MRERRHPLVRLARMVDSRPRRSLKWWRGRERSIVVPRPARLPVRRWSRRRPWRWSGRRSRRRRKRRRGCRRGRRPGRGRRRYRHHVALRHRGRCRRWWRWRWWCGDVRARSVCALSSRHMPTAWLVDGMHLRGRAGTSRRSIGAALMHRVRLRRRIRTGPRRRKRRRGLGVGRVRARNGRIWRSEAVRNRESVRVAPRRRRLPVRV